jgi:hypothetical protein
MGPVTRRRTTTAYAIVRQPSCTISRRKAQSAASSRSGTYSFMVGYAAVVRPAATAPPTAIHRLRRRTAHTIASMVSAIIVGTMLGGIANRPR